MRSVLAVVAALLAGLLLPVASASGHVGGADAASSNAIAGQAGAPEITNPGPCTAAAAQGMPEGEGHDH